jgi:hypothetical protein
MRNLLDRRRRAVHKLPPLEEVLRGSIFVRTLRAESPCAAAPSATDIAPPI